MRAGSLDRRIEILAPPTTLDQVGDERGSWRRVMVTWANRRDIGANEILRNPEIKGTVDVVWTIRDPRIPVDSRMRLQDQFGRLYEITGIMELPGRRRGYQIMSRSTDKIGTTVA